MGYLVLGQDTLDFTNRGSSQTVSINANGQATTIKKPDWLTIVYTQVTFTADSNTEGRRNSEIIDDFETATPNAANGSLNYSVTGFEHITDWYLPARDEFTTLVENNTNLGSFPVLANVAYWTSTQFSAANAISTLVNPDNTGTSADFEKTSSFFYRPVRKVTYTTVDPPFTVGTDVIYGIVYYIDTTNKFYMVAAKEDLGQNPWGARTESANANYTSQATFTVEVNDRYIVLSDVVRIGLSSDNTIYDEITVSQASSTTDSQSVFLKDIIDNIMVQSINEDSYLKGIARYHALQLAKRLMQDLNYDAMNEIRVYESTITAANKVLVPEDYVDYVRLSLVTTRGMLIPIFVNKNLNISFQYLRDNSNEIITDNLGYPIKTQGSRREVRDNTTRRYFVYLPTSDTEYIYDNAFYGITGGQVSETGDYRYDPDAHEFLLDNIPDEFSTVVLEYISDPILAERDPTRLRVHKYFQSAMEAGIYYMFIDKLRNVPRVEKEAARREFYNEVRKARRRIFTKPQELYQKMGADVGFDKML